MEMGPTELTVIVGINLLAWPPLGGWVAAQKGRPIGEGVLLGLLFGPIGVLIAALLPADPEARQRAEAADQRRAAAWKRAEIEARQRHERAEAQARARRAALRALPGRAWAGLGEVGRAVALGLALAVPAVAALVLLRALR